MNRDRVQISFKLDPVSDRDIIDYLRIPGTKIQTVIKSLIRAEIRREEDVINDCRSGRRKQGATHKVVKAGQPATGTTGKG